MAKKRFGFGRILDFIGLDVVEEPEENFEEDYPAEPYGRQQEYVPPRQQSRSGQSGSMVPRRSSSYAPTRPADRGNRNTARRPEPNARGNSGRRAPEQRPERYNYPSAYGNSNTRFGSLGDVPAEAPRSVPRGSVRARTVMFTLRDLEDCCDVIDNLITENTVVLTMDALDPRVMQRAVDTLSGAVFALHATIRKASEHTYLIAPAGVEVNETYDMDRY